MLPFEITELLPPISGKDDSDASATSMSRPLPTIRPFGR